MVPKEIETYQHEDVKLVIHYFEDQDPIYWIQSGVAAIKVSEEQLLTVRDMIDQHEDESLLSGMRTDVPRWSGLRIAARVIVVLVLVVLILI